MDLIVQYVISEISKLVLASPRTLLPSPPQPLAAKDASEAVEGGFPTRRK